MSAASNTGGARPLPTIPTVPSWVEAKLSTVAKAPVLTPTEVTKQKTDALVQEKQTFQQLSQTLTKLETVREKLSDSHTASLPNLPNFKGTREDFIKGIETRILSTREQMMVTSVKIKRLEVEIKLTPPQNQSEAGRTTYFQEGSRSPTPAAINGNAAPNKPPVDYSTKPDASKLSENTPFSQEEANSLPPPPPPPSQPQGASQAARKMSDPPLPSQSPLPKSGITADSAKALKNDVMNDMMKETTVKEYTNNVGRASVLNDLIKELQKAPEDQNQAVVQEKTKQYETLTAENKVIGSLSNKSSNEKVGEGSNSLGSTTSSSRSSRLLSASRRLSASISTGSSRLLEKMGGGKSENTKQVTEFLTKYDQEIQKEESKLEGLKTRFGTEKGQAAEDTGRSIGTLQDAIKNMYAIKAKLVSTGAKDLKEIKKNQSGNIEDAKNAIKGTISDADKQIGKFESSAKQLIDKFPARMGDTKSKLEIEINEATSKCIENLDACKERAQNPEMWGLVSALVPSDKGLVMQDINSLKALNKVTSPFRANAGEVMPGFIESAHSEIMNNILNFGLEKSGPMGADLTIELKLKNLDAFRAQTGEASGNSPIANQLNEGFGKLMEAYKGRGAQPQKYMDEANSFLEQVNIQLS